MAAIAIILSFGCQLVCNIFLVKSKLSTLTSSLKLPEDLPLRAFWRFEFSDGDATPFVVVEPDWPLVKFELITRLGFSN